MSSEMPMALILLAASMKRVTTTGASPSNGSSSSSTAGDSAIARAMATIFFWPPDKLRPRRAIRLSSSGKSARMRSSRPPASPPRGASQRPIWRFSATLRSGKIPASSGA
jgi:hypothetical protein